MLGIWRPLSTKTKLLASAKICVRTVEAAHCRGERERERDEHSEWVREKYDKIQNSLPNDTVWRGNGILLPNWTYLARKWDFVVKWHIFARKSIYRRLKVPFGDEIQFSSLKDIIWPQNRNFVAKWYLLTMK